MGISILELVLRRLREENFVADVAFPGQKFPPITKPVAAVHIEKVDRANLTVTVEVSIICPASMGGTYCEVEALRATEVLRWEGATCIQHGCEYDGLAQVYVVSILATFTCITEAEDRTMGPGFRVYLSEKAVTFAVSFEAEQILDNEICYEMGEDAPIGIGKGRWYWKFRLEELIPAGSWENHHPEGVFQLRIETATKKETYYHCRWTSVRREFTREGLRLIRSGISVLREEKTDG
jgi:hypothetical protein